MEKTKHTEDTWIEDVSSREIVREIDLEARERLGMTFEEFARSYREGTLEDTTATNELAILLRLVDPSEIPA
ncbi:hypothetical protein BH23ACT11_BH23ACT11_23180 [soil metagenome]